MFGDELAKKQAAQKALASAKYNKVFSLVFEQDIKYYTNVTPTHLQDYWQRIYDKASSIITDNVLLDHNGHMLFDENNKIIRYK